MHVHVASLSTFFFPTKCCDIKIEHFSHGSRLEICEVYTARHRVEGLDVKTSANFSGESLKFSALLPLLMVSVLLLATVFARNSV